MPLSQAKIIPKEKAPREDKEEEISKAEGVETTSPKDQICSASIVERMGTHQISAGLHGIPSKKHNQKKDDNKNQDASKSSDSAHCIVAHCNLGITEMNSLSSYKDCWLLDTGATSDMTFRKDCFEELNETINGIVYFVDKSSLKPKGMGNI